MISCNHARRLMNSTHFRNEKFRKLFIMKQGDIQCRNVCASNVNVIQNVYEQEKKRRFLYLQGNTPYLLTRNVATTISAEKPGLLKRMAKKMGWLDHSRSKLRRSGFVLYGNIGEKVSAVDFIEVCDLPDTFFSWFLVIELHVWMLMVRLMAEGEEGRYARNCMVEALWEDVETRAKKLGDSSPTARSEQIQEIVSSFQSALFTYDEGLISDDKVLANALWRRLFTKECSDPERLECIVQYVRRQMAYLDSLPRSEFLIDCKVEWIPVLEKDNLK